MNVLILINSFKLGGAEKLSYDIAKKLEDYSDCHVFLCSMSSVKDELDQKIFQSFEDTKVTCLSLNKPKQKGRVKVILALKKIVKQYHIDVIHTNGQSPDFYARIMKVLFRCPKIVVTIHSTKGYSTKIEQKLQKYTDAYTAVSREAAAYAEGTLQIRKKVHVIENGIDFSSYSIQRPASDAFTILSVGRIGVEKNYLVATEYLAPFLKKHPDVKWVIYGDKNEHGDYYGQFTDTLKKNEIQDSVVFKGVETDPAKIYGQADCFVLASQYEGFGIAYIEAMASKLPVFGRSVGVMRDIRENGGFYFDFDQDQIACEMERLYNKQTDMTAILEKNRTIVLQMYDLQRKVAEYHDIFKSVCEK